MKIEFKDNVSGVKSFGLGVLWACITFTVLFLITVLILAFDSDFLLNNSLGYMLWLPVLVLFLVSVVYFLFHNMEVDCIVVCDFCGGEMYQSEVKKKLESKNNPDGMYFYMCKKHEVKDIILKKK